MAGLLDLFGFLTVVFRGVILALASLVIGGICFGLLVGRYSEMSPAVCWGGLQDRTRRFLSVSAILLVVAELLSLGLDSALLVGTVHLSLGGVVGANFFVSGLLAMIGAVAALWLVNRREQWTPALWLPAMAILGSLVATSHAMARLEGRALLAALTAVHQGATAVWVGGLCFFLVALRGESDPAVAGVLSRRFSRLSQVAVALLLMAGLALAVVYVGSPSGLYGTNYGVMIAAKAFLFGLMLLLGGMNFRLVRRLAPGGNAMLLRLRRLGEAEFGIGLTVILTAASLTSQPPAIDLAQDRVTLGAIVDRFTPRVPRFTTPPLDSLSPSTRAAWARENEQAGGKLGSYVPGQSYSPPTPGDIQWSEYNHHWAGIVVLAAGLLAALARTGRAPWARHWPLAFIGLAVFLLLRADPENWPLGPSGFWESFSSTDVSQHRLFVLLITAFAAFEWGVQTGRLRSRAAALVFPAVCASGGALLMTHTHALANIKEELLAELSHIPLALFGVLAGWSRWLELRLGRRERHIPSRIWPVCLMMVGVVLLLYREA